MKQVLFLKQIKVFTLLVITATLMLWEPAEAGRKGKAAAKDPTEAPAAAAGGAKRPAEEETRERRASRRRRVDEAGAAVAGAARASASSGSPGSHAPRFARATYDTAFKHMFSDDEDRTPLISFLRALTGIPVVSVTFDPTSLPVLKQTQEKKQTFLDVACRDERGKRFIIEVQVKEQDFWDRRALYYAAGVFSQQLKGGEFWGELQPVIALNILDHDRRTLPDGHYKRDFQFMDREHLGDLKAGVDFEDPAQIPHLRIIQWELDRVNLETVPNPQERQWLHLLKDSSELAEIPEGIDPAIQKAYERLEFAKWGDALQADYQSDTLHLEQYQGAIARTRAEGREEGARAIAEKMVAKRVPLEDIMEMTGLSEEAIKSLGAAAAK